MTKAPVDFSIGDDLGELLAGPAAAPAVPHEYGAGTRLSNAYSDGVDGKPFANHHGDTTSAAHQAWLDGRAATAKDFARIRSYADQAPVAQPFVATCGACRGRGRFVSYAGRDIGPCYKCKGTGKTSHKTSPQVRERAKERRQEIKQEVRSQAAPQITWLRGKLAQGHKLPEGYAQLLRDLLARLDSGNALSDAQAAVISKGIARDAEWAAKAGERAAQRIAAAPAVDVSKIVDAFERAQEAGLKRFTLRFSGAHFQVDRADPSLIWISEGGYGTAKYGRIAQGTFRPGRDASAEVVARIQAIAADPLAAGIAYAQVTSSCSVCGRHLENQDSVDAGIGPVCAGRLNRPGLKFEQVTF